MGGWQPKGGVEQPAVDDPVTSSRAYRTADGGARNGLPEWNPYVRNPDIRARELAVAAMLEAVRARIRDENDGGEA